MKYVIFALGLCALAGCGANGAPLRPVGNASVSVGPGGISTSSSVGVDAGNVSVRVGL
jgi:hypothetical protein